MNRIKFLKNDKPVNILLELKNTSNNIGLATEIGELTNVGSGNVIYLSGTTSSKLESVKTFNYTNPYQVGINGVTDINNIFTAYTINNINYITYASGNTTYSVSKVDEDFVTKSFIMEEAYLNQAYTPFLDNQINIERQTISVMEVLGRFHLLKSVNSIDQYNNNFFNVSNQ